MNSYKVSELHVSFKACMCMYICVHMHTYTRMHIPIHICTHTYKHTHTQTHICKQVNECKNSYSTTELWLSVFKTKRILSVYMCNYYSKSAVPDSKRWDSFFYPFDLPSFILMVWVDTHELI